MNILEKRKETLEKLIATTKYGDWFDERDHSFKHPFVTRENHFTWFENSDFRIILVGDLKTGVVMIFEDARRDNMLSDWVFREVHEELTKELMKVS